MITKEELEHTFSELNNEALLEIVTHKHEHTELALQIALQELRKRKITEEDIANYIAEKKELANNIVPQNIVDDLYLIHKLFFYFIWLPLLTFPFKRSFVEARSLLKLKQVHYYSFMGFAAFVMICLYNAIYDPAFSFSFTLMVVFFIPTYFFDEFYNRNKQIERLQQELREQQELAEQAANEDVIYEEVIE